MNYYDLSNPSIPPTRGYRLGLWRLRRQRIYRILIALAAILTYILLYLTLKRDDYTNDMLKSIVLLFCSVVVFLMLLLVARNRIDVVRMRKREVQERHDYNYAMYRTLYKKNEKLVPLLCFRWQDSRSNCTVQQMALQALELVKREKLNVAQLRSFYFYQAAARLSGRTGGLAGSADQLLCDSAKTAAVITGRNRKSVFIGKQSGQTGAGGK